MDSSACRLLADLILLSHFGVVLFVLSGSLVPYVSLWRRWPWVRNPWFRGTHLAFMAVIITQSWLQMPCFLTVWEGDLRVAAQQSMETYAATTFMQHWVGRLLFYHAPLWVFALLYSILGLLSVGSLFVCPIRWTTKAADILPSDTA